METAEPSRKAVFDFCVTTINEDQLHSKTTTEVIDYLLSEVCAGSYIALVCTHAHSMSY